jgi:predicted ATPase
MHIREFSVRNFLVHRDSTIRLDPLTVLVGANGGGKSALFDAMLNFSMISRGNIRQAFGPYPYSFKATLTRGINPVSRIGFRVSMARSSNDGEWLDYEIAYAQQGAFDDQPTFTIFQERLTKQPGNVVLFDRNDPDQYPIAHAVRLEDDRSIFAAIRLANLAKDDPAIDPLVAYCTREISRFNKFRLDPVVLAQPNRLPEPATTSGSPSPPTPRLGYHGEDLAATLYALSQADDPALEVIRQRVREVDPNFSDFDFNSVGTDRIAFSSVYTDSRSAIPSVRLSAGNLTYIGLITLVSTENRPPVMMIEEPENGLTPQAVKAFYNAVHSLAYHADENERSQIIISSHSPFVICEAWNGEDRNFIHQVKVENGQALIRRFQEVIDGHGIQLQRDDAGQRSVLSLRNAELVMSGYMA